MTTTTKLSARQAWLSVALGVADGLPHPKLLHVLHKSTWLSVDTEAQAQRWVAWLDEVHRHVPLQIPDGTAMQSWWGTKGGRHYTIATEEPLAQHQPDVDAKARLAAALLSPDEETP